MKLSAAVKNSFVAGLVLVTPLLVTLFVLRVLVDWSVQFVDPVVRGTQLTRYTADVEVVAQVLAAVLILASITLLGFVARQNAGQRAFGGAGRAVALVPVVSTIYAGVRRVATALVERNAAYDRVVLVEYPREGVYAIGLVTGDSPAAVADHVGRPAYTVFLPNSPNPTGGRLAVVPEDQVHEIDLSVRRGMGLLVTTGLGADDGPAVAMPGDEAAAVPDDSTVAALGDEATATADER